MNIKRDDTVIVLSGKDKGKQGKVLVADPKAAKVVDKAALNKLSVMDCIECGMCTYVCPSKIDVTENVRKGKRFIMQAARGGKK